MENKSQLILEKIESYDNIVIYRHIFPDGDALGSQFGLASWIQDNYPEKKVITAGIENTDYDKSLFPKTTSYELPDNYLAISLDTPNRTRIDGEGFHEGNYRIRIDHHVLTDEFGDIDYVVVGTGSCTQIIGSLIMEWNKIVSERTANLLMAGLMTDTLKFSVSSDAKTFKVASFLASHGANTFELNKILFRRTYEKFKLSAKIIEHVKREEGVGYYKFDTQQLKDMNLTHQEAKLYINVMAGVEGIDIWCCFVQLEDGSYRASVRSNGTPVNEICNKYGGGGHRLACGINPIDEQGITNLLNDLKKALKTNS